MRTRSLLTLAVSTLLLVAAPAARAEQGATSGGVRILVQGRDGGRVDISLPSGWLTGLLAEASLHCDSDVDVDARRLARSLERQGEGGVFVTHDHSGRQVVARRSEGQLKIETKNEDGDVSTLAVPWPVARCVLLGEEPEEGLGHLLARDGVEIHIDGGRHDHGRVDIKLGDDAASKSRSRDRTHTHGHHASDSDPDSN